MERPNSSRDRILEAARELVSERGFNGVSLADIAKVVGISRTTVAYHYHPKERLIADLLSGPREGFKELMGDDAIGSRFIRRYVEFVVAQRASLGLLFLDPSLLRHPVFGPSINASREAIVSRLVGGAQTPVTQVTSWAIMGAINIAVLQSVDVEPDIVIETVDALAQGMLREASD